MSPGTRPLILFGGGLDSCVLAVRYHKLNPALLHFNYGQKAFGGETRAQVYFSNKYNLDAYTAQIDPFLIKPSPLTTGRVVTDASKHGDNYIPARNLLFSAAALSFASAAGLSPILLGASPAPPSSVFYDATLNFAKLLNSVIEYAYPDDANWVLLPLVNLVRKEYIAEALKEEPRLFEVSHTCYEGAWAECRVCVHCQQKEALARELGVTY